MCGIAGYIGQENVENVLLDFLEKLEYRGYDSAGIVIKKEQDINLTKDAVKIKTLRSMVKTETKDALGIAHTRWATHGKANKENAHPHYSNNKEWYVVHNGIIENYAILKQELEKNNIKFNTDTDSEVIPQLLEFNNVKNIKEFINTIKTLKGSYAICAINKNENAIYLAKYKNPLYVCHTNNNSYIASDPICFNGISDNYYTLNDNEFCKVSDKKLVFYNNKCQIVNKKSTFLNSKYSKTSKGKYSTFMEKEINEIPEVFNNIINEYKSNNYFKQIKESFLDIKNLVIIGCGTAYHSGLIGATYLQKTLKLKVDTVLASEFLCNNPIINKDTAYIFVSQSGETADTLNALNMVKNKCALTIALTNVTYSTLAKSCDVVLPVFAGVEVAVASTKAYNAQLLVFYLLSIYLKTFTLSNSKLNAIRRELSKIDISKMYQFDNLKDLIKMSDSMFVLGKYKDYYTALEASLKVREITYENCSALPTGELKHGTLALVTDKTLCFVISTICSLTDKTISAINEIKARRGKIVVITNNSAIVKNDIIDYVIYLPNIDEKMIDMVSVIPFQLFALSYSLALNNNPDQPRNLAKSVTVE